MIVLLKCLLNNRKTRHWQQSISFGHQSVSCLLFTSKVLHIIEWPRHSSWLSLTSSLPNFFLSHKYLSGECQTKEIGNFFLTQLLTTKMSKDALVFARRRQIIITKWPSIWFACVKRYFSFAFTSEKERERFIWEVYKKSMKNEEEKKTLHVHQHWGRAPFNKLIASLTDTFNEALSGGKKKAISTVDKRWTWKEGEDETNRQTLFCSNKQMPHYYLKRLASSKFKEHDEWIPHYFSDKVK